MKTAASDSHVDFRNDKIKKLFQKKRSGQKTSLETAYIWELL